MKEARRTRPNERMQVAVAAPASAPNDAEALERGIAALGERDVEIRVARQSINPLGYLAGSDAERAIELNSFLRDASIDVIVCARGGYGTARILDRIDYNAAKANRPIVVGYSDITALQLALLARAGLPSISGPMVAVEWGDAVGIDPETERLFWRALNESAPWELSAPGNDGLTGIRSGSGEGRLVGGNLAVLTKLVGTPYLPDLSGAILFVEDVGETPYRVDGCLAQLKNAGLLQDLAGVLIGEFTEAEPPAGKPSLSLEDVFDYYFCSLDCPVAANLRYGHVPRKASVPVGVRARLEVVHDAATVTVLESIGANARWQPRQ